MGDTPENKQALYEELFEGVDKGQCFTPGAVSEWTSQQFGSVDLPDVRLKKRCLELVSVLAQKPQDSINQANDAWAQIKGAYRFIENDRVTPESLQTPVNDRTAALCRDRDLILAIQDTTTLSFDSARGAEGLGPINDSAKARGMFYHSALALEESGLPIGLLDQQLWSRLKKTSTKAKDKRPILEKESCKWMKGVANAHMVLNRKIPEGRRPKLIHVFDREGDIHEILELIYSLDDGAVIRSAHNRRIMTVDGQKGLSRDLVRSAPLLGDITIDVPRKPG